MNLITTSNKTVNSYHTNLLVLLIALCCSILITFCIFMYGEEGIVSVELHLYYVQCQLL